MRGRFLPVAATLACGLLLAFPQLAPAKATPGSREAYEDLAHGSGAALNGLPPWGGVIAANSGRFGWKVLNFYAQRRQGVVRLYARYTHGPFLQAGGEEFADSATCPALKAVMLEAEHIDPPHLHNELLGGRPRELVLDGVGYELWGQADGPMAGLSITEAGDGAISAYLQRTLSRLQNCWTSAPPS